MSRECSQNNPISGEVTDQAKIDYKNTDQKLPRKLLNLLRKNSEISRKDIVNELENITEDGVKYHFNKLKRIGPDKGGHWEIQKEWGRTPSASDGTPSLTPSQIDLGFK